MAQLNEMTMNEEYWEDDDMLFGDEMMWGEGGYDGEGVPKGLPYTPLPRWQRKDNR